MCRRGGSRPRARLRHALGNEHQVSPPPTPGCADAESHGRGQVYDKTSVMRPRLPTPESLRRRSYANITYPHSVLICFRLGYRLPFAARFTARLWQAYAETEIYGLRTPRELTNYHKLTVKTFTTWQRPHPRISEEEVTLTLHTPTPF